MLPTSPREALENFIIELQSDYYPWYESSVRRISRIIIPLHTLALASGFFSSILAALCINDNQPISFYIKLLLVILPALGAGITTLIIQSKIVTNFQLRENGRLMIKSLINEASHKFASGATDSELSDYHKDLIKKIDEIEANQSDSFFSLFSPGK